MNPLDLLGPWKYLAYAAIAAALIGGATYGVHSYNESLREDGREEVREANRIASEAQTARNRDLQRAAELKYTVKAETRDRFITKTITEVRRVTESLASCPVPVDAVRLLNSARTCAGSDSPASCGASDQVPATR